MSCFNNITTNAGGIPLLISTKTTVGTETIDIAMGFRHGWEDAEDEHYRRERDSKGRYI